MKCLSHTDITACIIGLLLVFPALFSGIVSLRADTSVVSSGWLWGGSDDGIGINTGLGWVSMNNTTGGGAISYGVSIPADDGDLLGYAYSENMGYIAFDNTAGYLSGCPSGICAAYRVGNVIKGWARFVEIVDAGGNAGGNEGWIQLSGTAQDGSSYGVAINVDRTLSGYAWSDEFGFIDFSRVSMSVSVCSNNLDDDGDNWIDEEDPGCYTNGVYDPNDDDENNTFPACSDGEDNDEDGETDGFDPGCLNGSDPDETGEPIEPNDGDNTGDPNDNGDPNTGNGGTIDSSDDDPDEIDFSEF
ncbi:MAG: hypothetical protein H8D63_00735 [Parcubacteria group bacterium]|nr:hypothetical protein [Parcubacteria group bacterium]